MSFFGAVSSRREGSLPTQSKAPLQSKKAPQGKAGSVKPKAAAGTEPRDKKNGKAAEPKKKEKVIRCLWCLDRGCRQCKGAAPPPGEAARPGPTSSSKQSPASGSGRAVPTPSGKQQPSPTPTARNGKGAPASSHGKLPSSVAPRLALKASSMFTEGGGGPAKARPPQQQTIKQSRPPQQAKQQQAKHRAQVAGHKRPGSSLSRQDSFIEDEEDEEEEDWRKEMRAITGYDPSKYRDVGDDRMMVAGFNTVQAEERRSLRLGREADRAAEEEELRRQKAKEELKRKLKKQKRQSVNY
mmetsp:Transcript_13857/g.39232  ORF Transcript_13857/g.39232 Transcript_13857/m.39232 type:complete len:297 (+) Transcript_13857:341-1231(+)|eukprot:CAMPEP_0117693062 /NCGR_PEP_ID=MMETSP0804-20121206/26667_1 /TAXON_ID=1074897 /ORGANISM="Tetraselmis astigmatica, Strain CCMP880" /LENGTH=296 /DNA_ID=CAMNT_0005506565 /DNA_START=175 /DNA_END=1065 /DNA_ORIENTATION=-